MKGISFKDSGGLNLTQAVLSGRKTMTRRAVPYRVETRAKFEYICQHSPYKIGDVVAIKQAYKEVAYYVEELTRAAGWRNKMFVAASMMPHHIRITDIRVERLQDISNEDCLREGVYRDVDGGRVIGYPFGVPFYYTFTGAIRKDGKNLHWVTPSEAFAALIDKVSGRGTWESNPIVWVYSFELVY